MFGEFWYIPGLVGFCFGAFVGFGGGLALAFKLSDAERKANKK